MKNEINLNLASGGEVTLSLYTRSLDVMLFVHADFLSSQRPICDSTFRIEGRDLIIFTDKAFTSMKISLSDEASVNQCRDYLLGIDLPESNNHPHADSIEVTEKIELSLKETGDMSLAHINDSIAVVKAPSFEYILLLNSASPQALPPLEKATLGITSQGTRDQTHATFLFDKEHNDAIVKFWKDLRFPMHGAFTLGNNA